MVSEPCPDQPVQVSEFKAKPTDADHTPPQIIILAAVWSADRLPNRRANPGKQSAPIRGQLNVCVCVREVPEPSLRNCVLNCRGLLAKAAQWRHLFSATDPPL